jgi:hypothetical protein
MWALAAPEGGYKDDSHHGTEPRPLIREAPEDRGSLHARDLKIELIEFVKTFKAVPVRPIGEWRRLARTAIALISIPAIMHSRMGRLTQELREELIEIGIEVLYTP